MANLDTSGFSKTDSVSSHFHDLFLASNTFPQLLCHLCEHYPHFPMYSFLNKGEMVPSQTRTVIEVAHQAITILKWMKEQGVQRGDRVVMVFFPSLDFLLALWACFLGGFVPVPVPPPVRLTTDLPNFNSIVSRCSAKFCLSHNSYYTFSTMQSISETFSSFIRTTRSQIRWPDAIPWLYIDKALKSAGSPPSHLSVLEELQKYSSNISRDDLAYLQLTSGSTALPKMVKCTHSAVNYNSLAMSGHSRILRIRLSEPNYQKGKSPWSSQSEEGFARSYPVLPEYHRTTVVWVPHYHDFFMSHLLSSLLMNSTLCFMSPLDFMANPLSWITASIRLNAIVTSAPNFALDYVVSKTKEKDRIALANSDPPPVWRASLIQGGERMQGKSVAAFLGAFPFIDPGNFCNAYGMAEAVAGITGQTMENGEVKRVIPMGICHTGDKVQFLEEGDSFGRSCYAVGPAVLPIKRGVENTRIIIANPETLEELPEHHVGEIWVSSPSMGRGYFGWTEAENASVFENIPSAYLTAEDHRFFMRTGDKGFIDNGTLYMVGRYKSTLILRGRNFEPSDIEYSVWNCHRALRPGCTVAMSVPNEQSGTDELVFVSEVRDESLSEEVFQEIAYQMREHIGLAFGLVCTEILFFGPRKGVEKTSSGKPRRGAILEKYLDGSWKPLSVSKVEPGKQEIPVDYFSGEIPKEMELPDGAEEKIEMIMENLRRPEEETQGEEQSRGIKRKIGLSVLEEQLQEFSVASSDLVRLQSLVQEEFGVYVPSATLLQMDMTKTVRQFFYTHVFSRSSTPHRSASPIRPRPASPARVSPSSSPRFRHSTPTKSRRLSQKASSDNLSFSPRSRPSPVRLAGQSSFSPECSPHRGLFSSGSCSAISRNQRSKLGDSPTSSLVSQTSPRTSPLRNQSSSFDHTVGDSPKSGSQISLLKPTRSSIVERKEKKDIKKQSRCSVK